MGEYFLGIDLGTGSCKCALVDAQAQLLGLGQSGYTFPSSSLAQAPHQNYWDEQDPQAVLQGMVFAVQKAIQQSGIQPSECAALSIGGALHNIMALDHAGRPLTGILTWADQRAAPQAEAVRQSSLALELYQQTGCPSHGMYPLYKIRWLQEQRPEIFSKTAHFVSAKEYAVYQLTGELICDYGLAGGSGLINIHELEWNQASLDFAGISLEKLSPLADPRQVLHLRKSKLIENMGLSHHIPLVLGCSDAANSSLGAGAIHPGQATCMVGTSGALRVICDRPILHPQARSWCYTLDSQHWLVGGAINNGGVVLSWLREIFNQAMPGAALSFEDLLRLAGQSSAGAHGLLCLPFLTGERSPNWNQAARGVFFGLNLHHTAADLARAVLEGVAFRFRSLSEMLQEIHLPIEQMRASGGFAHSELWLQIMASALGRELVVPLDQETSSRGAAFWAMLGYGYLANFTEMADLVHLGKSYQPVAADAITYEQLYAIYQQVYQAIVPAFEAMTSFQKRL